MTMIEYYRIVEDDDAESRYLGTFDHQDNEGGRRQTADALARAGVSDEVAQKVIHFLSYDYQQINRESPICCGDHDRFLTSLKEAANSGSPILPTGSQHKLSTVGYYTEKNLFFWAGEPRRLYFVGAIHERDVVPHIYLHAMARAGVDLATASQVLADVECDYVVMPRGGVVSEPYESLMTPELKKEVIEARVKERLPTMEDAAALSKNSPS